MVPFCGQESGLVDANGRVRFSPRFQADFQACGEGEVVMHCLPEGAVAVYPEGAYQEMRRGESRPAERAAQSLVFRRQLRRFGALSQPDRLSRQGRITLPAAMREFAELEPGAELVVVGVELGVELWNKRRWEKELRRIHQHLADKGEREMASDLATEPGAERA